MMERKGAGLAVGGPGLRSRSATHLLGDLFMSTLRTLVFPFLETELDEMFSRVSSSFDIWVFSLKLLHRI